MRVRVAEYSIVYTLGALGYCIIEVLWRGYSHWSMTVTGGICFMMIYFINELKTEQTVLEKSIIGAIAVTVTEFVVGCIVNIILGWGVWDYSDRTISLLGQICPEFFVLWFILCIPATVFAEKIKRILFHNNRKIA